MNEELKFESIDELYNRLKPAFNSKINELCKKNIKFIQAKDIWDFLSKTKWVNQHNLELCDMVDDIFNFDEKELINFLNQKN